MELRIFEAAGNVLLKIRGRIILDETDRLKSSIMGLISPQTQRINLDLAEVDFIDSAGLGALVGIKVTANKHRARLALLNPSRGVSDILMVSKLDSIFDILTGPEAEQVIAQLAQAANERQPAGAAAAPSSRGPAMPSMPAAQQARPGAAPGAFDPDSAKERIDRLCRDAVEFMKRGDYESAAEAYAQALQINPDYLPAHNNLAIVYEKRPHWHQKAIEQWKKVLDISSRNNDTKHMERAQKHLQNLQGAG